MNKKNLIVIIFLLLLLPFVLMLVKQRQEIRKKAAANEVAVVFGSSHSVTLQAGGQTTGAVNISNLSTPVLTATVHLVYDPSKITISLLNCGSKLATPAGRVETLGDIKLTCLNQGAQNAVSDSTFSIATFRVTANASTDITLGIATVIGTSTGASLSISKVNGSVQVGAAPTNNVFFSFVPSAVSPGGRSLGTVKITAGNTAITSARIVLSYNPKNTVSHLACTTEQQSLSSPGGDPVYSSGSAEITCGSQAGSPGIQNGTFNVATFDILIPQNVGSWTETINFANTTQLGDRDGQVVAATLTPGTFQITGGTPPPAGITVNPQCGNRGTAITITGPNLGTEGKVCLVKESTIGYPCGYNMATSRTNSQIVATIPTNLRDDEITTPFLIRIETSVASPVPSSAYITPAPTLTVSTNCATPPPTTAPTATPVVTPTPTVDPNRPGVFSLVPASTTVGANPVLVEIKLNSGGRTILGAQAVVLVDSKLAIVNASGQAVTVVEDGNVALPTKLRNSVVSNKITYYASKQIETSDVAVNGTLAKFYVKTGETTGTAILSFQIDNTQYTSGVWNSDQTNLLGSTQSLTLNIGTTPAGDTFKFKLKMMNITSKPTTPNISGLDYLHHNAKVIVKSGDNKLLEVPVVVMTVGDAGLYTSADVNMGSFAAGSYKLYVKPEGYFQKRFTGVVFPPSGTINLTENGYKFEAGDVNNDGVINVVDIGIVINAIVKQANGTLTADDYKMCDYDLNGIINSGDVASIFETMKIRYDDE